MNVVRKLDQYNVQDVRSEPWLQWVVCWQIRCHNEVIVTGNMIIQYGARPICYPAILHRVFGIKIACRDQPINTLINDVQVTRRLTFSCIVINWLYTDVTSTLTLSIFIFMEEDYIFVYSRIGWLMIFRCTSKVVPPCEDEPRMDGRSFLCSDNLKMFVFMLRAVWFRLVQ